MAGFPHFLLALQQHLSIYFELSRSDCAPQDWQEQTYENAKQKQIGQSLSLISFQGEPSILITPVLKRTFRNACT